jgi:crotonobetainyl-CoA:carnitine CoA-transferase CaiB-like acyl-CoA transferase
MFQPLTGIRIVDLTQVLAGPYATYQMGLMGAEVIKVELPGRGDWTREGMGDQAGMGTGYLTQNANKRSVTIDLKQPRGIALLRRFIEKSDVFVENYRPGAAARLGLSFEDVRAINPKILYCSISAYGQDGPIGHRPAYDHVVQGMCGIMQTTGTPETAPNKVGAPYIDYATGLNAAFAIVSALHEVRRTEKAIRIDVAMLDTSMLLMSSLMTNHLTTGWEAKPSGNEAWSQSPSSSAFETTDGTLMIAANNDRQFERLCTAIGREDILTDPRWAETDARRTNALALREELANTIKHDSADAWEIILDRAGVPGARVRTLTEVLAEDQLKARQITAPVSVAGYDAPAQVPTLGFKVDGKAIAPTTSPPELGSDTDAVLQEFGCSEDEIATLRKDGII